MVFSISYDLFTQGKNDPKHQSYLHPIMTFSVAITSIFLFLLFSSKESDFNPTPEQHKLGIFLLVYCAILFLTRFKEDSNFY